MKKALLTLTVLAGLTLAAKAQDGNYNFEKGNVIVEGNIAVSTENNKNTKIKSSNFGIAPQAAYFLTDKFALGLSVGYTNEKEENYTEGAETKEKLSIFAAGVFGRYYFLDLGSRFKTYAQVSAAYGTGRAEETAAGTTVESPKVNTIGANAGLGINYFVTDRIAINFGLTDLLNFTSSKFDTEGAKSQNEFNANINSFNNFFDSARFGLTFKF